MSRFQILSMAAALALAFAGCEPGDPAAEDLSSAVGGDAMTGALSAETGGGEPASGSCGNGAVEQGERCDGDLLPRPEVGDFVLGAAFCRDDCLGYDTTYCTACLPDCGGRECGEDGCGGSCGACSPEGVCRGGFCCMPDCAGKECGSDGCGGSCGACDGEECHDGRCGCEPHVRPTCVEDDSRHAYWENSCGEVEEVREECDELHCCRDGACWKTVCHCRCECSRCSFSVESSGCSMSCVSACGNTCSVAGCGSYWSGTGSCDRSCSGLSCE